MTQTEKVLKALQDANGEWVSGTYFLRTLYLSQYHARIWELQQRGYKIEASEFTDAHGFKSYRLPVDDQPSLGFLAGDVTQQKQSAYEGI